MFSISKQNLIKEAYPYEMNIPCIQEGGHDETIAQKVIEFITENTEPKAFDEFCKKEPEYKLHHGGRSKFTALHAAATKGNISLIKHITTIGGKDLLNVYGNNSTDMIPLEITIYNKDKEIGFWTACELIRLGSPVLLNSVRITLFGPLARSNNFSDFAKLFILNGAFDNKVVYKKTNKSINDKLTIADLKDTDFAKNKSEQAVVYKILADIKSDRDSNYEFLLCADRKTPLSMDVCRKILSYNSWKIRK